MDSPGVATGRSAVLIAADQLSNSVHVRVTADGNVAELLEDMCGSTTACHKASFRTETSDSRCICGRS